MVRGKKPTRRQKELIKKNRLNPNNWLVQKNPYGQLYIINRHTNAKRVINYR